MIIDILLNECHCTLCIELCNCDQGNARKAIAILDSLIAELDSHETVEKADRCIFEEYYPLGYGGVKTYNNASESHKENLRRCGKAAIEAIKEN